MRELIFDAILFVLVFLCWQQITYIRHRLEMNIMVVQGLQHQIDELRERLKGLEK
jgi:hypothetical protein